MASGRGRFQEERDLVKRFDLGAGAWAPGEDLVSRMSQPAWADVADSVLVSGMDRESGTMDTGGGHSPDVISDTERLIDRMQKEMKVAAGRLDFERAATLRDRIFELQNESD